MAKNVEIEQGWEQNHSTKYVFHTTFMFTDL